MKAQIMRRAWEIARGAVAELGGKVKEFFAEALRMAWAEAKSVVKPIVERIEELEKLGFRRWTKGDYDRLYISPEFLGLSLEFYKSGNVCHAELDGEEISHRKAEGLRACKTYIDVKTEKVYSDCKLFAEAAKKLAKLE